MKKIILLLLFIPMIFNAQERNNEIRPILSKKLSSIKDIIGWEYNEYEGKWIENKNNAFTVNCQEIFFTKINYNDQVYYIMTIKYNSGAYRYPTIKKDWMSWKAYRSYIFTEIEYQNLKNYKNAYSRFDQIDSLNDFNGKLNFNSLRDSILFSLKLGQSSSNNFCFVVKKENNQFVRFILPTERGDEFLDNHWGFDKCYFETLITNYDSLFKQ